MPLKAVCRNNSVQQNTKFNDSKSKNEVALFVASVICLNHNPPKLDIMLAIFEQNNI